MTLCVLLRMEPGAAEAVMREFLEPSNRGSWADELDVDGAPTGVYAQLQSSSCAQCLKQTASPFMTCEMVRELIKGMRGGSSTIPQPGRNLVRAQ